MKDDHVLNCIFQKRAELMQMFHFRPLEFTLLEAMDGMDVCRYLVKRGLLEFGMAFVGGTSSNVDFVHFILQFFGQFGF
jgi:hypothetical protein